MKLDIENRADILQLLQYFYDKLLQDEITNDIFKNLDMESHIPLIADFWSMVLLGEMKKMVCNHFLVPSLAECLID